MVGGDLKRAINFTDEEISEFVDHAKGLGFKGGDIEAILIVKLRKPWVELNGLKDVASHLARNAKSNTVGFKNGWTLMSVYREAQKRMLSGKELDPSDYLDDVYMQQHLGRFEGKASYLVTGQVKKKWIDPEQITSIGRMDGQFHTPPDVPPRLFGLPGCLSGILLPGTAS